MFGILRSTFDAYLVGLAQKAGAKILTGRRVVDVKQNRETVTIDFADGGSNTAKVVVGADGAASVISRRSGLHQGWQSHEVCRTIVKDIPIDSDYILEHYGPNRPVHLFLKFNQLPGYAWVFPKTHHINVGLGCFANFPTRLIDNFRLLVMLLKKWEMLPQTSTSDKVQAGICPTMGPLPLTQKDRILLVGDAAGFVSPSTGAGIVPGMISGRLAAETLTEALEQQKFDAEFLKRYQIRWENQIGQFKTEKMIQRIFLTRWCNLFIRIGERDEGIRQFVASTQSKDSTNNYGQGVNVLELLTRVLWALLKGPFGRL